jgi:hypothetical protein
MRVQSSTCARVKDGVVAAQVGNIQPVPGAFVTSSLSGRGQSGSYDLGVEYGSTVWEYSMGVQYEHESTVEYGSSVKYESTV